MNVILDSPWVERIGWALLHSLWQGALIWSLAAIVFAVDRKLSAARRHWMGWLAITLLAFCPLVTITWLACKAAPQKTEAAAAASASVIVESPPRDGEPRKPVSVSLPISPEKVVQEYDRAANAPPSFSLRPLFPFLVIGWLVGVVMLTVRLALGWWWLSRLRHRSAPVAGPWTETFANLRRRLSLPASMIRSAGHLGIPMVVGWLRPVIYLPASLLSGQSAAEVEAVFLHEMAHLKRHDLLLQLWVTIVETLLFYHPAVHALGRITRETAEEACDDLVLQWTSDGRSYARALVSLEESRGEHLALAASGGRLRHRLRRILGMPQEVTRPGLGLRFGFTACAGVALYLFLVGVAVPQLAKALTPAERVALIEKKRDEVHAGVPDEKPKELIAIGQINLPTGANAPESFTVNSFSLRTGSTFSRGSSGSVTQTQVHLKDVRVDGQGELLTVAAWLPGFAPAQTQTSPRDPATGRASFDLKVETGFPAIVKLVDERGNPISDAKLSFKAILSTGDEIYRQGVVTTDAEGQASPGNVLPSNRISCEVMAHGFCWNRFPVLTFTDGKVTEVRMEKAEPVVGDIIDADTKKPVEGCRAYCPAWNSPRLLVSHGYGGTVDTLPEMAARPSDAQGRIALDVCHPQDSYVVVCSIPGYQQRSVNLEAGVRSFRVELKRGLVLAGIVHDPDHLLKPYNGKVMCILSHPRMHGAEWFYFPANPEGFPIHFDQLPQGDVSLTCGGGKAWKIKMDRDLKGIEWRVSKEGLVSSNGPPVLPEAQSPAVAKRQVRIHFTLPAAAPPMNGKVRVTNREANHHETTWAQEIVDSVARMEVAPPAKLKIRPEGVPGWTFNEMDIEVKTGDGPVEKDIEVIPAGAVTGIFRNDPSTTGKPLIGRLLVIDRAKMPSGLPWRNLDGVGLQQFDDKHYYTSLPLHGSYRVVGWTGTSFAESPLITLDDAHPFIEQDVSFVKGVDVTGHLLQPDGKPCRATVVRFIYQLGDHDVLESVRTGMDGSFQLPGVNFDMSGHYLMVVEASPGIAPLAERLSKGMNDFKLRRTAGLLLDAVLVDDSDKPVSGARLAAVPQKDQPGLGNRDRVVSDAPSDADGKVHFSSLKPGKYFIGVDQGTHEILQHQLSAGEMADAEVPVKSSEPLRFRVKERQQKKPSGFPDF